MSEISKEMIIRTGDGEVNIALLEDKGLVEYHNEKLDKGFNVGDIFLGRIKRLVPGLNAAFVDVGYEKDAFLHYHDLGPQASIVAEIYFGRNYWKAEFRSINRF